MVLVVVAAVGLEYVAPGVVMVVLFLSLLLLLLDLSTLQQV